jgi:large subunit ribosomal protein L4
MPQVQVHSLDGAETGSLALDERVFGAPVRGDLVHAAVVAQLAAKRAGTHSALTRGGVSGGGKKPYRQKGTGRARQGSISSPQYKGGGVAFPPIPRKYDQKLPRKVKRAALFSAWSDHVAGESLLVVDSLELAELKTKLAAEALTALLLPLAEARAAQMPEAAERPEGDSRPVKRVRSRRHVLLLLGPAEAALKLALRNLETLEIDVPEKKTVVFVLHVNTAPYASVYDLTLADAVVASRSALERVTAEFAGTAADADEEEVEA